MLLNSAVLVALLYFGFVGTGEFTQTVDVDGRRVSSSVLTLAQVALVASSVPALTLSALLATRFGVRRRSDLSVFA